jgi:hypothetical protein
MAERQARGRANAGAAPSGNPSKSTALRPRRGAHGWLHATPYGGRSWLGVGSVLALAQLLACDVPPPQTPYPAAGELRDTAIVHEPCEVDGPNALGEDVNGDARPDLRVVKRGEQELCRAADLNFDGKVDVWTYRDPSGAIRRRESDFDRDGRTDEIALYRAGELMERHRATTLRGRLDTWQYYTGGKLVRAVRDSNGDSMIDEWWEYSNRARPECPLVHSDADHDGRPDPGSTVNLCADELEGSKPKPEEDEEAETFKPREAMPVELTGPQPASSAGQAPASSAAPAGGVKP